MACLQFATTTTRDGDIIIFVLCHGISEVRYDIVVLRYGTPVVRYDISVLCYGISKVGYDIAVLRCSMPVICCDIISVDHIQLRLLVARYDKLLYFTAVCLLFATTYKNL